MGRNCAEALHGGASVTYGPLLIGIGHKARVGKDTLAWLLVDALRRQGVDARRYGWADALKAICRVEYGMRTKDAPLLQRIGVAYREGCRADCYSNNVVPCAYDGEHTPTPDVWVEACLAQIDEDAPQVAIIPDTRFPNEADAIRARRGRIIRVERPHKPASGRDDTHVSETALDALVPEYTVINDGTLRDLTAAATPIVRDVLRQLSREGR